MAANLKQMTFMIPVRIDSPDRHNNINYVVEFLIRNFDSNIIVYENGPVPTYENKHRVQHIFEHNHGPFHRTRYLNIMTRMATTDLVANYDCDVIFPLKQITRAYQILQLGEADAVFPYDGYFVNIMRYQLLSKAPNYNVDHLNPDEYANFGKSSMGGALFWNKKKLIAGGMENENFVSWGCEDWERIKRFSKLGFCIGRVKGPLYHINHARSVDSDERNPFYNKNVAEFQKIENMPAEGLREYIKTWPWLF